MVGTIPIHTLGKLQSHHMEAGLMAVMQITHWSCYEEKPGGPSMQLDWNNHCCSEATVQIVATLLLFQRLIAREQLRSRPCEGVYKISQSFHLCTERMQASNVQLFHELLRIVGLGIQGTCKKSNMWDNKQYATKS